MSRPPPLPLELSRNQAMALLATAVATAGVAGLVFFLDRRMRRQEYHEQTEPLLEVPHRDYTVHLMERIVVGRHTRLLRFALPKRNQVLGCAVGEHVFLSLRRYNQLIMRPYTPVSLCDQRGSFDVIVKVYLQGTSFLFPAGGTMSQLLDQLHPGDSVQVQGPKGKFRALGRGQFVMCDEDETLHVATNLGLVAAGSGVTPMLQLLRHRFADADDFTRIAMVDVNNSERDIIVRDELDQYARKYRRTFKICHVLDELPEKMSRTTAVKYRQGPLTQTILQEILPPPSPLTLILLCGPPRLISEVCRPALLKIGHDPMRVLVY